MKWCKARWWISFLLFPMPLWGEYGGPTRVVIQPYRPATERTRVVETVIKPAARERTLAVSADGEATYSGGIQNLNRRLRSGILNFERPIGPFVKLAPSNARVTLHIFKVQSADGRWVTAIFDDEKSAWRAPDAQPIAAASIEYTVRSMDSDYDSLLGLYADDLYLHFSTVEVKKVSPVVTSAPAPLPRPREKTAEEIAAEKLTREVSARFKLSPEKTQRAVQLPLTETAIDAPTYLGLAKLSVDELLETVSEPPYFLNVLPVEATVSQTAGLERHGFTPSPALGPLLHDSALGQLVNSSDRLVAYFPAHLPADENAARAVALSNRAVLAIKPWVSSASVVEALLLHLTYLPNPARRPIYDEAKSSVKGEVTVAEAKAFLRADSATQKPIGDSSAEAWIRTLRAYLRAERLCLGQLDALWFLAHYRDRFEFRFPTGDFAAKFREQRATLQSYLAEISPAVRHLKLNGFKGLSPVYASEIATLVGELEEIATYRREAARLMEAGLPPSGS